MEGMKVEGREEIGKAVGKGAKREGRKKETTKTLSPLERAIPVMVH